MYKVLIIEDDPMVAMINGEYVSRNKGFEVAASFRNGQDALKFLETASVDLILLDVFMPYMNGIETLKKIREMKIHSEVIMVTAANDTATLEETMNLGVMDYLIKPFNYERFVVALEKFEVRNKTLKDNQTVDQSRIDTILSHRSGAQNAVVPNILKKYPKGIQEKTVNNILEYCVKNPGWQCGDVLSQKLGFSSVTIRHYMNYLISTGSIEESINYETGGRPSMLYRLK